MMGAPGRTGPPAALTKEPAVTETSTAPAVTGFHHFSPTVSDVEASAGQPFRENCTGLDHISFRVAEHDNIQLELIYMAG
jgi:hypothetical protein